MFKRIKSLLIIVVLLTIGFVYVFMHAEQFEVVKNISIGYITAVFCLTWVSWMLWVWMHKEIYAVYKVVFRPLELYGLVMISSFANLFLPPGAGTAFKAVYLKKRFDVSYANFTAGFAAIVLITLAVNAFLNCVALLTLYFTYAFSSCPLWIIGLMLMAFSLLMVTIPIRVVNRKNRILTIIHNTLEGWVKIRKKKKAFIILIIGAALRTFLLAVIYKIAFFSIGESASLESCLALATFGSISRLMSITPGAAGIYEGAVVAAAQIMGISLVDGLVVVLFHRSMSIICLVVSTAFTGMRMDIGLLFKTP